MTEETQLGGGKLKFAYDPLGAMKTYQDQVGEATTTEPDLLGRPLKRNYPDGTYEQYVWKGVRLESYRDRQGRTRVYHWNPRGQLEKVTRPGGETLDHLEYDAAGRLVRWTNADTALVNEEFDLEGRPRQTRQIRYRDGTGHTTKQVLDEFVQEHRFNELGERTYASMPAYPQMPPIPGATQGLSFAYDPLGNLVRIGRAVTPDNPGTPLLTGSFRGAGRADERIIHTACEPGDQMCEPAQIVKSYGYDEQTGQLNRAAVSVGGLVVAGSEVTHDGLQVASARLLGVSSNERRSFFRYDERGRLAASLFATLEDAPAAVDAVPGRAREDLTPADFRTAQDRASLFDDATKEVLVGAGIDPATIEPQTVTATESAKGHKIEQLCRGAECEQIGWSGSERTSDGRFFYEWDDRGRLVRVIEKPTTPGLTIRRIVYAYSGADRLVGRTAQYAIAFDAPALPPEVGWKLEDRPVVLEADRLPAETTFVWDPVTDQLIAAFRAGATGAMPHAGLLRQILHGGYAYDDPIEVTVFRDPAATMVIPSVSEGSGGTGGAQISDETAAVAANSATPAIEYLYPLYDEAGGGTLQAILGSEGEIKLRSVTNDPYGAEETELAGPMVDRVTIGATKNAAGAVSEVRVTIGLTEAIAESTVAAGVQLATVDAAGEVVRLSTGSPALVQGDPFRIEWVLSGAQWQELLSPVPSSGGMPHSLSIAVTSDLRAAGWAEVPVLPASDWAVATHSVTSTAERPVEVGESIGSLTSWLGGLATGETSERRLLKVESTHAGGLSEASRNAAEALLVFGLHAAPFEEVVTGHAYFRARWLHASSSAFLSPDTKKYRDSSSLYSFVGGDPINRRDPTGMYGVDFHYYAVYFLARAAGIDWGAASDIAWSSQFVDNAPESNPIWNSVNGRAENVRLLHFVTRDGHLVTRNNQYIGQLVSDAAASANPVRLGITLHGLADSYSHEGFTFTWDSRNIRTGPYSQIAVGVAATARMKGVPALPSLPGHLGEEERGHANDYPYNNVEKALEVSRVIFGHMKAFARAYYGKDMDGLSFEEIEPTLREVFARRGDDSARISFWRSAIRDRFEDTEYRRQDDFGPRRHFTVFLRDQMRKADEVTR